MDLLTANDTLGQYPQSYYAAHAKQLDPFPTVKGNKRFDVCIIGAGFSGLSAALHLAELGYKVVVLEAQRVGFGASGRNGGQVGTGQRMDQTELEKLVGLDDAKKLWKISKDAVQLVKDLSADLPDCSVAPGVIHCAHRKRYVAEEHAYADHLQNIYDHSAIIKLDREEMREIVNSDAYFGGVLDMEAGHIDPLRYVLGLARKCIAAGVVIFEQSKVHKIDESDPATVFTDHSKVSADFVLLACNGYLGRLNKNVAAKVMPINNFIAATRPLKPEEQEEIIKNNHAVADSKFVVNYFRFSPDHRMLFGGTESYGYRFPTDIANSVRKPMADIFPQLKDIEIDYAWGGTLGITMNRMPHFERLTGNVLSISGYSGHGVAMASMGGKMAALAIHGQATDFDIMARVPTHSFPGGAALRSPLLVLAMLWYSLRDRF